MIVPMKKVAVVCLADDRDSCLQQLQELGLLHISSVAEESDPSLISTRESLIHAEEAKSFLLLHSADDEGETTPCTMPADQIVDYVLKLRERMQEIADKRSAVIRTIAIYEPFGDFNPQQAAELADKGLSVHLLRQPNSQPLPSSGDGIIQILSEDRSNRSMVAIGDVEITESATEIPLPERSLAEEQKELNDFNEELIAIEKELSSLTESADSLTAEIEIRNEQNEFATAKAGMQRDREVSVLQGFIPEGCEDALTKAAAAHK